MEVKEHFFPRGKFVVQNGTLIRFWEDWWIGREPLMKQFPELYNIVRQKHQTVASVMSTLPLNISFRRALVGGKLKRWFDLVALVMNVNLGEAADRWEWNLGKHHMFSVKSMYNDLMQSGKTPENCALWKLRLPLKVKIFLWYIQKGVTLTKDSLLKRDWRGEETCCFCSCKETIQHLFFDCHLEKFVRNFVLVVSGLEPPSSVA